jgi:hypothetical protein
MPDDIDHVIRAAAFAYLDDLSADMVTMSPIAT